MDYSPPPREEILPGVVPAGPVINASWQHSILRTKLLAPRPAPLLLQRPRLIERLTAGLAHSVTLAVAALGLWVPRADFVEPAIALSIAYVGIENCFGPEPGRRWRLTFLFGLVHGFGFAGALGEIALPPADIPLALLSFNLGVEAGQLAVLSILFPVIWWAWKRPWFERGGLAACSAMISAMGLWWFAARISGG